MSDAMVQEQWLTAQQTVLGSVMIDAACADAVWQVLGSATTPAFTGIFSDYPGAGSGGDRAGPGCRPCENGQQQGQPEAGGRRAD